VTATDTSDTADAPTAKPSPVVRERQPKPLRWAALAIGVVLVALLVVLATRRSAEQAQADSPLLGKPAPEVTGPGIDGTTIRLSQLRGRYVLVNFFASWCVPCANEHDDLVRFQTRHEQLGDATVLAVTFNDTLPHARDFFEKRGGDWPVLADDRGKVALDFGVRGPPESFLVDPNGIVLTKIIGEVDDQGLEALLNKAKAAAR
jgi:cytochrome c biogenesis protein CcmG/thiol:disulfide interchange protein DsbE